MINVKNKKLKKVKNSSSDDTKAGDQFDLILVDTELKKKKWIFQAWRKGTIS